MARYKKAPVPRAPVGVVYVGPLRDGVTIVETGQHAPRGVPVEVPADLAARLTEQAVWEPATKAPEGDDVDAEEATE